MPNAPARPCSRCGRPIRGRCPRCQRAQTQARGSAGDRGYDVEWATYARNWLAAFPWCGQRRDGQRYEEHSQCTAQQEQTRAEVVDHIIALRKGGARLDPANHQSLCRRCNAIKAHRVDALGPSLPRIGPCRDPLRLWFLEFRDARGQVMRRYFADRPEARAALRAGLGRR